jgi:hypothetical protein
MENAALRTMGLLNIFFRTIKYDKFYLEPLETGSQVQRACHEFIHYFNHKRDHSAIGNCPPMVFYKLAA